MERDITTVGKGSHYSLETNFGEASYLSNNDESKEVKWQLNFDRHCISCCISISWLSICHNWANSDVLAIVLCSPNVKQFSE